MTHSSPTSPGDQQLPPLAGPSLPSSDSPLDYDPLPEPPPLPATIDDSETEVGVTFQFIQPYLSCRSVENYERLNRIEEGSYGTVFRGRDQQTGEVVALKKIKMDKEKEGFPKTSLREIKILTQLAHPNILHAKEIVVGSSLDSIFIVMEYLDHDLRALMMEMDGHFTIPEVKCLMLQLLSGVTYLHDNWVLHRDLKTSNLLMNNRGVLKIADFGLSREYGSPLKCYTDLVVTLWYRPPELLLGAKKYSTAVDMWSVGCIFAELLTKRPLFAGQGEMEQLNKIFKMLGSPNERIWPGLYQLPLAKKINFPNDPSGNLFRDFAENGAAVRPSPTASLDRLGAHPRLSSLGMDLLGALLTYDPAQRFSAAEALKHPFWAEYPGPVDPEAMPAFPSRSDPAYARKKRRKEHPSPDN